jgi:PAS domain S-box-containing protein
MNSQLLVETLLKSCVNGLMILKPVRDSSNRIIDFEWIFLNDKAYTILRFERCHLIGKKLLEQIPSYREEGLFSKLIDVVNTGDDINCEFVHHEINNESIWVNLEASKYEDGIACIFQDVSQIKNTEIQLKKTEERYKLIQSAAHIGYWEYEISTEKIRWSDEVFRICGFEAQSFEPTLDKAYSVIYPGDLASSKESLHELLKNYSERTAELRILRPTGEIRWVISKSVLLRDNEGIPSKMYGYFLDITDRINNEIRLRQSEILFRSLFNSAGIGIVLVNMDGKPFKVNERFARMVEYTEEELSQLTFDKFTYPEDLYKDYALYMQVIEKKIDNYEIEKRYVTKSGKIFWALLTISVVRDENLNFSFAVGMIQDINERKIAETKLQESELQFKLFVNQAPSAIAMFDKDMNYIAVSSQYLEDYSIKEDVIGKNLYEIFPETGEGLKRIYEESLSGKFIRRLKDPFESSDGTLIWLRWEVRPWYDYHNEIGGVVLFSEDITEDIRQEESILKLNKDLEDLNQQKVKLFSLIAHDIKSPVANCVGLLNVISLNKEIMSKDELLNYLRMLEKSAFTVNELIDELLTWAQTQFHSLTLKPEKIRLQDSIQKLLKLLLPVAAGKSITIQLEIDSSIVLWADQTMLNTIIRNLISNAIKFSKPGGAVKIKGEIKNGVALISVSDKGVGIKEEDMDKLFNSKSHFTSYGTSGEKGTGLGLDISKNFVHQNGGEIFVTSKVGQGSTFSFTLPLYK